VPEPHATLCRALRAQTAGELCGALGAVRGDDWPGLLGAAEQHGLVPLLWHDITRHAAEQRVPLAARLELEQQTRRHRMHRMVQDARLRQIIVALDRVAVPHVLLKGPALAATVYRPGWLRPYGDFDLLLHADDWPAASDALRALGYSVSDGASAADERPLDGLGSVACALAGAPVLLEAHFDLLQLGWSSPQMGDVWARARRRPLGDGLSALMLAPEEQVVQACVHLFFHGFYRLIWFEDLRRLLRCNPEALDWSRVVALAEREGAAQPVWYALRYLDEWLGVAAPGWAMRALARSRWERWLFERLWSRRRALRFERFEPPARLFSRTPPVSGLLLNLALLGRRREKLQQLARYALPPRQWMAQRHGTAPSHPRLLALYARHVATVTRNAARLVRAEWRGSQW
jgi:hypothetical protein